MKTVGVFCSSSSDCSPVFFDEIEGLGRDLSKAGFGVLYGGANCGPMGALAKGVLEAHGKLIGVVPEMDFMKDLVQPGLSERYRVANMQERKAVMIKNSDGFLVFPGGIGTLDEALDVMVMKQVDNVQK